jgi:hypothetical protein
MSNVHIRSVEDADGNLVDLIFYHHGCSPASVPEWPCPEPLDYIVTCGDPAALRDLPEAGCGLRVTEVGLTAYGLADADPDDLTREERREQPPREFNDEDEEFFEEEFFDYEDDETWSVCPTPSCIEHGAHTDFACVVPGCQCPIGRPSVSADRPESGSFCDFGLGHAELSVQYRGGVWLCERHWVSEAWPEAWPGPVTPPMLGWHRWHHPNSQNGSPR